MIRVTAKALLAMMLFAVTASAERLSLDECLQRAERSNPALKAAAWDVSIAEENIRLSQSGYFPRIDAQGGYTAQPRAQAVKISNMTAETQQAEYATAGVAAYYTLYDFGRRSARQQQARHAASSTGSMVRAKHKDVALQVIEAYFGILESARLLQSAEQEIEQISRHRKMAQALFEEGLTTRNDVLQADVRLAASRQKAVSIASQRENIWLQLNYLTGAPESYRAELDADTAIAVAASGNENEDSAIGRRHEIQALREGLKASEAEVNEAGSNYLPELYTRLAMDYVQNSRVREQTIMSATVGLKLNIFDGFSTSAIREKAIRNRSRSQDILRQTEARIRLELATARNDVNVAKERIKVTESAVKQSEENLRINQERYKERVGTATEVLDAQTLNTQAKTDYYNAVFDFQVALARLKKAQGTL